MACIALYDELVATPTLAGLTKVPPNYLAKVLQLLAGANLIVGRRGVGGGYRLARPAEKITLLEVINAVDPVKRIETCPLGLANHGPNLCPLHRRADQAAAALIDIFGGVSLRDLLKDANHSKPLCDTRATTQLTVGGKLKA